MKVEANIDLSADDTRELARVLKSDQKTLAAKLAGYARAALTEYTTMLLGQKVLNRGSDIREYRLFLMILHVFDNSIPSESDICRLFQCTPTESRALMRSVMSKYQSQVHGAIEGSVREVLGRAKADGEGEPYRVTISNATIVEILNSALASADGNLPQVAKFRGTVSTYQIAKSSYEQLRKSFA